MYNPKKEKIIDTARNIFSRFGIRKSTMDEIARKIRMAKSTLYHYFKNKEEIFLEVVKRESVTMKLKLKEAIETDSTPQDKFKNYARTRMIYLNELDNYYSTLTDAYFELYPFTEEIRRDFTTFETECLEGIFREGVKKGVFELKNTRLAAQMVIIAFKGFEYTMITKDQPINVDEELDMLIDIFFKGIEKR